METTSAGTSRSGSSGRSDGGELVAFNKLAGRMAEPVLRVAALWQPFQAARVGVDRLGDVLNAATETQFSATVIFFGAGRAIATVGPEDAPSCRHATAWPRL